MSEATKAASLPLRVLVVDSDDRIRETLTRLLPIGGRCLVVGSAGKWPEAFDLAESMSPDVVVVDPRIPDLTIDPDILARLRALSPGVRVVVLALSDPEHSRLTAPGADAYIRKTFRPQELIDAVVSASQRTVA